MDTHALGTALMPPRVHKPHYLLVRDPINIPFNSTEDLKDPRLDYYTSTSPSWVDYSVLSELDQMLQAQLETEEVTTTEKPSEERTPAMQWITLDCIGTVDDF